MPNSLYRPVSKGVAGAKIPLASDVAQIVDVLSGNADVGQLSFAGPISTLSTGGISLALASGGTLGIGVYRYKFTYVTGLIQADGTPIVNGETPGSATLSTTTTTGNQKVTISGLPAIGSWPVTAIGIRIYRTVVGGADGAQKLVTTLFTNYLRTTFVTSFLDGIADASLGAAVPTANTTGTTLGIGTAPAAALHIADQNNAGFEFDEYSTGDGAVLRLKRARGTILSPSAIQNGDNIAGIRSFGYNSSNTFGAATGRVESIATENHTSTAQGSKLVFYTTQNGSAGAVAKVTIDQNGALTTLNNTLDDGTGKQTIIGDITYHGNILPQLRYTNGYVEWNNGGTWQGVGGVKNVQRGIATVGDGQTLNITISAVNMSKSFLSTSVAGWGSVSSTQQTSKGIRAQLTSTTNLELYLGPSSGYSYGAYVSWEVIESY